MKLFTDISSLYGIVPEGVVTIFGEAMQQVDVLKNAWLLVNNGKIEDFGTMEEWSQRSSTYEVTEMVDLRGAAVLPGFVDSHTHIVFAGSREQEFVDKINGLSYEEIFRRGGGIINSSRRLQAASEEELLISALYRLHLVNTYGTTSVEIKSGYGLSYDSELKTLRVIRRLKEMVPVPIRATFLGAHAIPPEYKDQREKYIDLVCDEMIPQIAEEKLADYCDVFCDQGFFTPEETERILDIAIAYGLQPKLHANELGHTGGVAVGVKKKAVSVDHLEYCNAEEIAMLASSSTIPTLLPGTAFYLRIPYAPARDMLNAGLPVALASDYNPGSCPSGNMQLVWALGCIQMKMLPEEAFYACTLNAAAALGWSHETGSITRGKRADFIVCDPIPSLAYIPYAFGTNHVKQTYVGGSTVNWKEITNIGL